MTYAQVYQHGLKAYIDGITLTGNPHNVDVCEAMHGAWGEGWLEASRARSRMHSHEHVALSKNYQSALSLSCSWR